MFALVEPCVIEQLAGRANLGCAMLIAACRERGLAVSFVAGQSHILSYLAGLDPETTIDGEAPIGGIRELYQAVLEERGPRPHFNGVPVARLEHFYTTIMRRLMAQLEAGDVCDISLVDDYVERIAATGCRVVGFSLQYGFDPLTREVRRRLREEGGFTVIGGGPEVTRVDLRDYDATLRREHLDYLVTGPGERILPSLLEHLAEGRLSDDLPNTFFLHDGRVTGFEEVVRQDLDTLPFPDFSDVDFDGLISPEKVLPLESARGCSWDRCAFCDHNAGPVERYSPFSVDRVVEILRHLQTTYDCHEFTLHDLELPPGRASKLSRAIVAEGLVDLGITAYARFSAGYKNAELWASMRKAGFTMITWGLESGCQRTLVAMRKGTRVSTASEVLRMSAEAGVANGCFIMFGFPGETEDDANETLGFLREHRRFITRTMIDVLNVRPGSPLGREPERWGIREVAPGGEFVADKGVGLERAMALKQKLAVQEAFDPDLYSSEPVKSVAKTNASRVLYGLLRSHRMMPPGVTAAEAAADRLTEVFPLVLGEIHDSDGGSEWRPIAVGETPMVNLRAPRARRRLDDDELDAYRLADGTRSLAAICGVAGPVAGPAEVEMRRFIMDALRAGSGLMFDRRWEP